MDHEGYEEIINYWKKKDAGAVKLPRETLCSFAEDFLTTHAICSLATGSGDFVRCTPVEYGYHRQALWIFSEGGLKFRALENNPAVCVAVYEASETMGNLNSMQIDGTACLVEPFSQAYLEAAAFKHIPIAALKKLPMPMNLIKVTPIHADLLCSAFKKQGASSRQSLDW